MNYLCYLKYLLLLVPLIGFVYIRIAAGSMLTSWCMVQASTVRLTANGEVYDMYGHTAAHKTLPFGTKLRVCYDGCVNVRTIVVLSLGLASLIYLMGQQAPLD